MPALFLFFHRICRQFHYKIIFLCSDIQTRIVFEPSHAFLNSSPFSSPVSSALRIKQKMYGFAACSLITDIGGAVYYGLNECAMLLWGRFHWHNFTLWYSLCLCRICALSLLFFSFPYLPSPFRNNFDFPEATECFEYVKPLWDTSIESSQPSLTVHFSYHFLLWQILILLFFYLLHISQISF